MQSYICEKINWKSCLLLTTQNIDANRMSNKVIKIVFWLEKVKNRKIIHTEPFSISIALGDSI